MFKLLNVVAVVILVLALSGLQTETQAGPVVGKILKVDNVKANQTDIWTFTLQGGQVTRIRLAGDGDTCLEMRVFDEFGNLVAADTLGFGDVRQVTIKPIWAGKFQIKIRNLGSVSNSYALVVD